MSHSQGACQPVVFLAVRILSWPAPRGPKFERPDVSPQPPTSGSPSNCRSLMSWRSRGEPHVEQHPSWEVDREMQRRASSKGYVARWLEPLGIVLIDHTVRGLVPP
ncbi:MAG: hypothetical protein MJA29_01765 [Candidatus Omnitrophica bacterium]|nr:hypothetical protein [Candidatus Omnitrophota bacterium]